MGLTERHWFEDEEPELTESQLEDILWENNKIFEKGYQKGFSDGKSALLREQEPVPVIQREVMHILVWCCGSCGVAITDGDKFCRMCGKAVKWDG
jgi:rubrerythrin